MESAFFPRTASYSMPSDGTNRYNCDSAPNEVASIPATPSPRSKPNIGKKRSILGRGYDMTAALTTSPARTGHVDGLRRAYRNAGATLSSLRALGDDENSEGEQCSSGNMSRDKNESLKTPRGHEHSITEQGSRKTNEEAKMITERESSVKVKTQQSTITYPSLVPSTDADWAANRYNGTLANGSPPHRRIHNFQNPISTPTGKREHTKTRDDCSRSSSRSATQQGGIAKSSSQDQKPNAADVNYAASTLIQATATASQLHLGYSLSPRSRSTVVFNNMPASRPLPRPSTQQALSASASTPPQIRRDPRTYPTYKTCPVHLNSSIPNSPQTRNLRASRFTIPGNTKISTPTCVSPTPYHETKRCAKKEDKKMVVHERYTGKEKEDEDEETLQELSPNVEIYRKGRARRRGRSTLVESEEEKYSPWLDREADCGNVFGTPVYDGDRRVRR